MERCNLCQEERRLEDSHIIPKFITKWLKETGTGGLRKATNFNKRVQDGIKEPFLCEECEDKFNKSETYFCNSIFHPVVNDNIASFEYTDQLFYFVISVLWRLLRHTFLEEEKGRRFYNELRIIEEEWRNFLFEGKVIKEYNTLHLIIGVDILEENESVIIPDKFIQYMARIVDAGVADDEQGENCMIYLKLPRFIFIVPIKGLSGDLMINTQINQDGGTHYINKARVDNPIIADYFISRVRQFNALFETISQVQRKKMQDKSAEIWDSLKDKDLRKIIDYENNKKREE